MHHKCTTLKMFFKAAKCVSACRKQNTNKSHYIEERVTTLNGHFWGLYLSSIAPYIYNRKLKIIISFYCLLSIQNNYDKPTIFSENILYTIYVHLVLICVSFYTFNKISLCCAEIINVFVATIPVYVSFCKYFFVHCTT